MSILPPQSALLAGTECEEDFWRAASHRLAASAKSEADAKTEDASNTWTACGDYLWLVTGNADKSEKT